MKTPDERTMLVETLRWALAVLAMLVPAAERNRDKPKPRAFLTDYSAAREVLRLADEVTAARAAAGLDSD